MALSFKANFQLFFCPFPFGVAFAKRKKKKALKTSRALGASMCHSWASNFSTRTAQWNELP